MASRRVVSIGIAVVLILVVLAAGAAGAAWYFQPIPATLTIEVSGTRGLPIKGTFEVDGTTQELNEVVPTKFVQTGKRITFLLTTTAHDGEFRLRTYINDKVRTSDKDSVPLAPSGSDNPPKNSVRGWVKAGSNWSPPTGWIEPFNRDTQPDWLTPPPP
jgi:hypothetical protein